MMTGREKLWNQVESALVGGVGMATETLVRAVASGSYEPWELRDVAKELVLAIDEIREPWR
jgi:hypothetical protein